MATTADKASSRAKRKTAPVSGMEGADPDSDVDLAAEMEELRTMFKADLAQTKKDLEASFKGQLNTATTRLEGTVNTQITGAANAIEKACNKKIDKIHRVTGTQVCFTFIIHLLYIIYRRTT